jgi:nucleotide-binding universal stress UspA family protein
LDGSPEGESILNSLTGLIAPHGSVLLLHVLENPAPSSDRWIPGLLKFEAEAELYLDDVALRWPQFRPEPVVEMGDPAERILTVAEHEQVDALAMTFHPRGRLTSLFLGSVARTVVHRAGRPVLLVPSGKPVVERKGRRILVPLDRPEQAEDLLGAVEVLAKQTDSEIVLFHVLPAPRVADPVTGFNPIVFQPVELPPVSWLDPFVDLLIHHGVRSSKLVRVGNPADLILRESRDLDVSLIAVGTHGRGGMARLLLGSVTDQLLEQADRPVLLFHRVDR